LWGNANEPVDLLFSYPPASLSSDIALLIISSPSTTNTTNFRCSIAEKIFWSYQKTLEYRPNNSELFCVVMHVENPLKLEAQVNQYTPSPPFLGKHT
jgi:hypothetical protein